MTQDDDSWRRLRMDICKLSSVDSRVEMLARRAGAVRAVGRPGFYQELTSSPDGTTLLVSVLELIEASARYTYRICDSIPTASGHPSR